MGDGIASPRTPILYQNPSKTLTLLDIPTSIAQAQGTIDHPGNDHIYASPPLQIPYPSTEPKSEKAKFNVLRMQQTSDADVGFPSASLQQGLRDVAEHWGSGRDWCLPRKISPFIPKGQSKKRKADNDKVLSPQSRDPIHASTALLPSLKVESKERLDRLSSSAERGFRLSESGTSVQSIEEPLILSSNSKTKACTYSSMRTITNRLVHNPHFTPFFLQCSEVNYKIPPNAKFLLSKVGESMAPAFSMAALTMYPGSSATAGPGQFDFVLLDPPWENRSVRRSAKYETVHDSDPMVILRAMLGQHLAPSALVACWITNKASVRDVALESFQAWNVRLVEEWAWLKTTVCGLPVNQIDGIWRKPYEVLLLGRKDINEVESSHQEVQRRVIAAVPDLHSRKPHLKTLIEPFLPGTYRALEIFARNLTAEWWSWGDEVLKYNWEGHWSMHEENT